MKNHPILGLLFLAFAVSTGYPQSGGTFNITSSTVAGGSAKASGGVFTSALTIGQPVDGSPATGGTFDVAAGLPASSQVPGVAAYAIAGRIISAQGRGIRNAKVTLTPQSGVPRLVVSGHVGGYRFDDLLPGQTYTLTVSSRRFTFNPVIVPLASDVTGLNISAQP